MSESPSASEVRAYLREHSQTDAAKRFFPDLSESAGRSRVQRILKAGEDERGPVERSLDALIHGWGELDAESTFRANLIRTQANTVDWSTKVSTGQGRQAGTQAAQVLWKFLEDMGKTSGAEELQKFLRSL